MRGNSLYIIQDKHEQINRLLKQAEELLSKHNIENLLGKRSQYLLMPVRSETTMV